jgi:hypothetical protein
MIRAARVWRFASPLRRNPALKVAKFARDLSVFSAAKRRKSFFSRGLTYGMLYGRLVIAALRESMLEATPAG